MTAIDDYDDRDRWNAFVTRHPTGHLFQTWEWGELQEALGGHPRRVAVEDNGRITGVVQVLLFDSGARTFAYVPRGPVADAADTAVVGALIDAVLRISVDSGVEFLRVEPQWPFDADSKACFEHWGFTAARQFIMPRRTLLVDLTRPAPQVWDGFHSNTRNRIRLAVKRGVAVRVGGESDMGSFQRVFDETVTRHGLRRASAEMFDLAVRLFGRRDAMRLYLARVDGEDVAGLVVFLSGGTATYLWGASNSSPAARRANPNQLLHWTAIQWAIERGCTTYDLFGIPDYDADVLEAEYGQRTGGMWNLYRFKRGFGGVVHRHLGTFDWVFRRADGSR